MSAWSWIKTAGSALLTGAAGWKVYALVAASGAAAVLGASLWHSGQVSTALEAAEKRGADVVRLQVADAVATAHRENAREMSRLVQVNEEVQGAYNTILASLAADAAGRAAGAGLRSAERAAIAAAAGRAAADTCGRFAAVSERHIEGVEADADAMGQRAVRATAAAEAYKRTLLERRAALAAKREALTPTPTTKDQP